MEGRSTRSRVTLPDTIFQVSQESPLKKARSTTRARTNTSSALPNEDDDPKEDDELLLSPRKTEESATREVRAKRSASPPPVDEYGESGSSTVGRELKRLKRDLDFQKFDMLKSTMKFRSAGHPPSHSRNLSDSNVVPTKRLVGQASRAHSKKPKSTGHIPFPSRSSPPPDPGTGRAQSVPLFSSSFSLPHIDLRHPPSSPTRSRSPSKEPAAKLRINLLPKMTLIFEPIVDEPSTQMNVDAEPIPSPSTGEPIAVDGALVVPIETEAAAEPSSKKPDLPEEQQPEELMTPIDAVDTSLLDMSPLTPISDTPHPSKLATLGKLPEIPREAPLENVLPPTPKANPQLVPQRSLLPRPSIGNIAQAAQVQQNPPPPKQVPASRMSAPGSQQKQSQPNIFDIMMDKAQAQAKAVGPNKAKHPPHVVANIFGGSSTSKPATRIKMAMKPKRKGAEPPAPALVPIPLDEEDESSIRSETTFDEKVHAKVVGEEAKEVEEIQPRDTPEPVGEKAEIEATSGPTTLPQVPDSVNAIGTSSEIIVAKDIPKIDMDIPVAAEPSGSRRQSKLPRLPSAIPTTSRTTRSTSTKKDKVSPKPPANVKMTHKSGKYVKTISSTTKMSKQESVKLGQPNSRDSGLLAEKILPPGSPMKVSPARHSPRLATSKSSPSLKAFVSVSKSRIPVMQQHGASPSPPKLVRSASLSSRPASENRFNSSGSTLSTLSNALEKLRMPAPSRPSTSMGFSRDLSDDDDSPVVFRAQVQDDSNVGKNPAVQAPGLSRSSTVGSNRFSAKGRPCAAGSKQSMLLFPKVGAAGRGKPGIGLGWAKAPKASRNPGLATVIGSPVKGGRNPAMEEDEEIEVVGEETRNGGESIVPIGAPDKGKGKQRDDYSSRRASTVSHLLSESLNSFPSESTSGKGLMGPPAVPNLSARGTNSNQSPHSAAGDSSTPPGRRSTRIAAVVATAMSKKATEPEKPVVNEALKFLKDCVIYVDVKTEESEEAGSLFVEMLEGVGARLLQRVGKSCTHIVYKNGLQSTINRYQLLCDPKPLVVGIAWVVDCVEQRKKVDETEYLIDLEEVILFTNPGKRRRSMLPKLISRQFSDISMSSETGKDESIEGDVSMESASSAALEDLPPLERARRRKSMLPI